MYYLLQLLLALILLVKRIFKVSMATFILHVKKLCIKYVILYLGYQSVNTASIQDLCDSKYTVIVIVLYVE